MRRRFCTRGALAAFLSVLVLAGTRGFANNEESEARMRKDITFLASDECEGRGPGTKGIDKAADYIAAEFKKAGLKPGNKMGSYFQPFKVYGTTMLEKPNTLRLKGPLGQQIELQAGTDFQVMGTSGPGR